MPNSLLPALVALFWMAMGAAIGAGIAAPIATRRREASYPPHAELLGKPCWIDEGGRQGKFLIVAVSHKGSVAVREWDDRSGRHARWIPHRDFERGKVAWFVEDGRR